MSTSLSYIQPPPWRFASPSQPSYNHKQIREQVTMIRWGFFQYASFAPIWLFSPIIIRYSQHNFRKIRGTSWLRYVRNLHTHTHTHTHTRMRVSHKTRGTYLVTLAPLIPPYPQLWPPLIPVSRVRVCGPCLSLSWSLPHCVGKILDRLPWLDSYVFEIIRLCHCVLVWW